MSKPLTKLNIQTMQAIELSHANVDVAKARFEAAVAKKEALMHQVERDHGFRFSQVRVGSDGSVHGPSVEPVTPGEAPKPRRRGPAPVKEKPEAVAESAPPKKRGRPRKVRTPEITHPAPVLVPEGELEEETEKTE